jgi:hypothetical protein
MKSPWTKNPESNHIGEVQQDRSMTGGELLQCQMVWVGVSQCPTGALGVGLIIMAPRNSRPLNNIIHTVIAGHR